MSHLIGSYSDTCILHIKTDTLIIDFKAKADFTGKREFTGSGEEGDNLRNAVPVFFNNQVFVLIIQNKDNLPAHGPYESDRYSTIFHPRFIGCLTYSNVPASILDKSKMSLVSCNRISEVLIDNARIEFFFFKGFCRRQQIGETDNRIQRCPDFMAHICKEGGF